MRVRYEGMKIRFETPGLFTEDPPRQHDFHSWTGAAAAALGVDTFTRSKSDLAVAHNTLVSAVARLAALMADEGEPTNDEVAQALLGQLTARVEE